MTNEFGEQIYFRLLLILFSLRSAINFAHRVRNLPQQFQKVAINCFAREDSGNSEQTSGT
jgi:hypothetical protein